MMPLRTRTAIGPRAALLFALAVLASAAAFAALLPGHPPLRILIVSDEVNPHGLTDEELTQPGDLSAGLTSLCAGLNLGPGGTAPADAVREIATDDIAQATTALSVPIDDPAAYDVVIYFAHRIPNGAGGAALQEAFVDALEAFLVAGGGLVSFHHGSYFTAGKASVLDLVGGTASGSVTWNTVDGQNVIDVAPAHFVTTNGVAYTGTVAYADPAHGVPAGDYTYFNNSPDERYPTFELNPGTDPADVEILFASNYDQGGTAHLLGFTHQRPAWSGVALAYQPGEYQPNAVDDPDGANFQILANALVWTAPLDSVWIFDDGFECDATGAWSSTSP